jgi:hypothetical protein
LSLSLVRKPGAVNNLAEIDNQMPCTYYCDRSRQGSG